MLCPDIDFEICKRPGTKYNHGFVFDKDDPNLAAWVVNSITATAVDSSGNNATSDVIDGTSATGTDNIGTVRFEGDTAGTYTVTLSATMSNGDIIKKIGYLNITAV